MSVFYGVNVTALNRLKIALASGAVTPSSGQSLDAAGNFAALVIGTANMGTVLATITLQNPSFSFSGRVATLLGVPLTAIAAANGTAASALLQDKNGVVLIGASGNYLTVGTSGTDVIVGSTSITSGETITCTSGTITG